MEQIRKPFQGVWNIIRFNWHFYLLSLVGLSVILSIGFFSETFRLLAILLFFIIFSITLISLIVSFYVYDLSELYSLSWINDSFKKNEKVININAGFDETSVLIKDKFKDSELIVFDFYNPLKHTEISIKRARKAYPPYPNTKQINTSKIPLPDNSADKIFAILSIHEIRNQEERSKFFKELNRILKPNGYIFVTEHLRDTANFLAYNIGFFHFHSRKMWLENLQSANLKVENEIKITPFITTFILKKYDSSS